MCGFASLSLEILWVRLYSFAKLSTPAAFGFVLLAYLLGIALGAHGGARACRRAPGDARLWYYSIVALLLSALTSLALPALFGWMTANGLQNPILDILTIAVASSALAFVFPIAHHLGTRQLLERQGHRFALVYTSNVTGAALGPLVTGYILLEHLSLQQSFLVISIAQLAAAIFFALAIRGTPRRMAMAGAGVALAGVVALSGAGLDPHVLVQNLNQTGERATKVIENRHGIITLFEGKNGDDAVYGGNVYDGRTNLSPERNTNGLQRPLLMAALQPQPRRVLMVGLSIGTWLALVNEFPGVEQVDVVEINPGYLSAAQAYPLQARALKDPRVNVVVDDARRWLRHQPERRYDLIIMNTTWHWRSSISLLLSTEFLQLMKSHMTLGAVLSFNATGSGDAFLTASKVFAHAYRYGNFVYAADFDFRGRKDTVASRDLYRGLRLFDKPLFASPSTTIDRFLLQPFITLDTAQRAYERPFEVITDHNMITEFKYGRTLY
ncbi:hypothetical protein [Polaromonas sp. OV174]|uniref:spermine/spermidine synthase domain-containing protein n=1 Tax=Polaromonas sp. OV174 TaxID=1855300 RepID=UPI0015A610A0|nr:hypothetical protein [Polaromonas sp. OV174]